ncbi:MAG: ribonuclease P protein component [Ruminococcaceae bacterium]|nr:ribonuclease P protein component [Oscillospiraceae bacterium]
MGGFIFMKYRAISENHLYSKAYRKGKKIATRHVVIYVLPDRLAFKLKKENPEKKYINRVGLTVTKKIGNAVTRSRVKRIIREGYRLTDKEYGIKKGNLIVLVARDTCVKAKSTEIKEDMIFAFRRLGMIQ